MCTLKVSGMNCAVLENLPTPTPPQKALGIPGGGGGPKALEKLIII